MLHLPGGLMTPMQVELVDLEMVFGWQLFLELSCKFPFEQNCTNHLRGVA
jgi:hypothetical protein